MPPGKNPCRECREKHLKCNEDSDPCRRCRLRSLKCHRQGRLNPFKNGSSAKYEDRFAQSQQWVSTQAKEFRFESTPKAQSQTQAVVEQPAPDDEYTIAASTPITLDSGFSISLPEPGVPPASSTTQVSPPAYQEGQSLSSKDNPNVWLFENTHPYNEVPQWVASISGETSDVLSPKSSATEVSTAQIRQEAYLIRYYVEEISHWFDITDPHRRFELVVPQRAQNYSPLRHAICAVSARHIARKSSPRQLLYASEPAPGLNLNTAHEYMLKSLPVLKDFHNTQDEETRELIVATAVILRQFEEMEDDGESDELEATSQVNLLGILNTVLRSSNIEDLLCRREVLYASYWVALRQEVYYALRKGYAPQMAEPAECWNNASLANQQVLHACHVAKWLYSDKSKDGWLHLKNRESFLLSATPQSAKPLLHLAAERKSGSIFPTVWFNTPVALTGTQHFLVAKMLLIAESPFLMEQPDLREALRESEGQVREIVLCLCGISMQHPKVRPAVVYSMLGILRYGHYFVDEWERENLRAIVQSFAKAHIWSVPRKLLAL